MTRLTDKTFYATGVGVIVGLIIYSMSVLFQQPEPTTTFTVTETVIEAEVVEQITQETDCVEIIEYDMSTGTKTTVGCTAKEST